MSLQRKVVLITGGSKGLGRIIAIEFAKQGYEVALTYAADEAGAKSVTGEIEELGGRASYLQVDVSDEKQVESMKNRVVETYGRIDVLINNAGIFDNSLVKNMPIDCWHGVLDVNLTGVFNCIKAVIGVMEKQMFGRIITIGSVVGKVGAIGAANYAASKAGILGLSKSVAREVARKGITVNTVELGYMDHGMTLRLSDKVLDGVVAQIPTGKLGDTSKAARMIVHLASEEAEYITGQSLGINGGFYM